MNQGIAIMQTALWILGLFTLLSGIRGRKQHHAHHREGANPRVWRKKSHRRQALVDTEAHHYREHHHHLVLRLHRNGMWRGGKPKSSDATIAPHHHRYRTV